MSVDLNSCLSVLRDCLTVSEIFYAGLFNLICESTLEADMKMKERAMNLLQPPDTSSLRYKPGDKLLRFLDSL
jgi:hypothetical protein